MAKPKRKGSGKTAKKKRASPSAVRDGGTRLSVRNSGLEVWLYDEANREQIRQASPPDHGFGGMPPKFPELTRQGIIIGYSLYQDDDLDITVYAGDPLTESELSVGRWLEPQRAFLRLPSGTLCVESNDASRVGPGPPAQKGGLVRLSPGDYLVTLYRIDHEVLDRERLTWRGPQEVIVLTPGGNPSEAAADLLPFQQRRDTTWVGKYKIEGKRTEALVWFPDGWDTFVVNLDSAAAPKLSLVSGSFIRTHVPAVGITLISAFAKSWDDARKLPLPAGLGLEEYGYAAFCRMDDWDGAQALFCRRETTKTRIADEHLNVWIPAIIEVLDVRPQEPTGRAFAAIQLRKKNYFESDFLNLVLSELIPEAGDLDELPLPKALDILDRKLANLGLSPQGDLCWQERIRVRSVEMSCRLYAGLPDGFATILAGEGSFELVFLSELDDRTWVVTGLADEIPRRLMTPGPDGLPVPHPRVQFQTMDESLANVFAAHKASLSKSKTHPIPAPKNLKECVAAFERFLTIAFD